MELRLHHIIDHLYNMFLENDGSENCAPLLEEEVNKMFGTKYLIARSKDIPSRTHLPGNGARKELG